MVVVSGVTVTMVMVVTGVVVVMMVLTVMLLLMMVMVMITWVNLLDFFSIAKAFALRWSLVIDDYDVAVVEDKNDNNVGVLYYLLMKQG